MTEDQGFRLGDLRGMVRRRWPVAVTLAGSMALLAIFVAAVLPNVYQASATLLVEPQSISKKLIESGVAESDLNNRLHLMTMQILSRPRLSKIIDDLKLYPEESEQMTREEVIELMRKHISVEPVLPELETAARRQSAREIEINTFRLNFTSESAPTAAAVANRLANDFIDEHIKERVQISGDTSEFIEAELQRLAGRIREVEAQTAQIKNDNPGRLPEDIPANQRMIEHAVDNLRDAQRHFSEAQSDEAFYRQASLEAGVAAPNIDEANPRRRVDLLQIKLGEYRSRGFTDKHPDIIATQLEIEQLKQRLETESEDEATPRSIPQQQAEAEMRRAALRAQAANEDMRRLAEQVEEYNARLNATPRVEEQLAGLNREYENLLKNMENYGAKRLEAGTAANMERRQKGEQFRVLDSAVPPPQPTSPKRLVIVLVGIILGVAFGGGVAVLLESADTSFHGARDLQSKLRIPVLAEIPAILLDSDRKANRRRQFRTAFAASVVVFLVLIGSGSGYFWVNVLPRWRAEAEKPPEAGRPAATPTPAPPAAAQPPTPTPAPPAAAQPPTPTPAPPAAAQPAAPPPAPQPSAAAAAPAAGG